MSEYNLDDLTRELDCIIEIDGFSPLPEIEEVLKITEKAVLLNFEGYGEKWIPKSVLREDSDETFYVKDWFYKKEF